MKEIEAIIKEPVSELIDQHNGWYIVVRANQPQSKRYNVGFKKDIVGYNGVLYDFKEGKTHNFKTREKNLKTIKDVKPEETNLVHEETAYMFKNSTTGDNGYLKNKKIDHLLDSKAIKVNKRNTLVVPYTTFDLYPKPTGAKLITEKGDKISLKNSRFKGAFHPHRYNRETNTYILGEGMAECIVAKYYIDSANVLEIGGCHNLPLILNQLPENSIVYVMAENGSEHFYDKIKVDYPAARVIYPPDPQTKDFADFYVTLSNKETIKDYILGISIDQKQSVYKALGVEDKDIVVYSKILNKITPINPSNVEEVLRICAPNSEHLKSADKKVLVNRLFYEAAKLGSYDENCRRPIGLWKNKDVHYYNDGVNVYEVQKDKLVRRQYEDIIDNDFLLCKVGGFAQLTGVEEDFKYVKELEEILASCDWENKELAAKIILGFLVQGHYAGSAEFRPHLWFQSNASHAGKSWISNWISKTLIKISGNMESGESTVKGTGQAMQDLAGHLFCDEIGEKDSTHKSRNKMMIELLRSAATAQYDVTLGSPEQKVKKRMVKFSTLLSCIDGKEYLKKQDYDRIIFLNLTNYKESDFMEKSLQKFIDFRDNNKGKSFSAHALKGFHLYQENYLKYYSKLIKEFHEIGHKARGLAACIAGYLIYTRDEEAANKMYKLIRKSTLIQSYEEFEPTEDIIFKTLNQVVSGRDLGYGCNDERILSFVRGNEEGIINNLGIRLKGSTLTIYRCAFDYYIKKYADEGKFFFYSSLKSSKYFVKESISTFDGSKTRVLTFNVEDMLSNSDQDKEKQSTE